MGKKKTTAKKASKKEEKTTMENVETTAIIKPVGKIGNLVRRI